jgi:hypothetical protein
VYEPIPTRDRRPFSQCERAAQPQFRAARCLQERELDNLPKKNEIEQHRDSPGCEIESSADHPPGQRL